MKNDHHNTYKVIWSENDNGYIGLCNEFPSLSWLDETPGTALEGIRKIVSEVVDEMKKEKEI